jgi:hypothetical protein
MTLARTRTMNERRTTHSMSRSQGRTEAPDRGSLWSAASGHWLHGVTDRPSYWVSRNGSMPADARDYTDCPHKARDTTFAFDDRVPIYRLPETDRTLLEICMRAHDYQLRGTVATKSAGPVVSPETREAPWCNPGCHRAARTPHRHLQAYCGVDALPWTLFPYGGRSPRCPRADRRTRRSSGSGSSN